MALKKDITSRLDARFWVDVDKDRDVGLNGCCWVWTGKRLTFHWRLGSGLTKRVKVRRVAWEIEHGHEVPYGFWVMPCPHDKRCVRQGKDHCMLGARA